MKENKFQNVLSSFYKWLARFINKYKVKSKGISHVMSLIYFFTFLFKVDGFSYISDGCTIGVPERPDWEQILLNKIFILCDVM